MVATAAEMEGVMGEETEMDVVDGRGRLMECDLGQ
jgi:hypothetical protein